MSVEKTPEVSGDQLPDDFAAYTAARQPKEETNEDAPVEDATEEPSEAPAEEPEAETESESETDEEKEHAEKKKGGFQRRIDKLTREKRELEARLAETEGRLAGQPAAKPDEKKPEPTPEGKPKLDQYETYDQYVEALADWKLDQREKARAAEEAKRAAATEAERKQTAWQERVQEFSKQHPDFNEVLEDVAVPISQAVKDNVLEAEDGPALAYWLAINQTELKRISGLGPLAAARELGKISAQLSKQPEPKKVTAAPAPVKPVGSKGTSAKRPGDMTFEEYKRYRSAGGGR